jgi:hypothetical protein
MALATTHKVFGKALLSLFNKEIDFDSDTIKVALLTSSYTPDQDAHDYFDDVVANEITGTGYTAGGVTLASKTIAYDGPTNTVKIDAADPTWTSATFSFRHAVIYDATPGTNATRPLISCITFDADVPVAAGTLTLVLDAAGAITATVA